MTEPSQYFKGRTVQEQMDEVIGYVDKRAEEVAAAKADDVLQPAEAAKTAAQAAAQEAEAAKNATIAALPAIQQDISGLKAEDTALDGRLNTVELKVQTAEGNIVTIQGQIVALQTADGQNVKITGTNAIGNFAVLLTGNQDVAGTKYMLAGPKGKDNFHDVTVPGSDVIHFGGGLTIYDKNNMRVCGLYPQLWPDGTIHVFLTIQNKNGTTKCISLGVVD